MRQLSIFLFAFVFAANAHSQGALAELKSLAPPENVKAPCDASGGRVAARSSGTFEPLLRVYFKIRAKYDSAPAFRAIREQSLADPCIRRANERFYERRDPLAFTTSVWACPRARGLAVQYAWAPELRAFMREMLAEPIVAAFKGLVLRAKTSEEK